MVKTTLRVNGGAEIDMDDEDAVKYALRDAFKPVVERGMKGHNRVGGFAVEQLKSVIARIENVEAEKAVLANDVKEIYAEARGNGLDVKAIRTIIKLRKMDASEREEAETILDTYLRALDMQMDMLDEAE